MAFVLLTFSKVVIEGWNSLGIRPSEDECGDYMFTWALIGHMLGVEAPLLCEHRCSTNTVPTRSPRELAVGLEPTTTGLQNRYSAN